MANPNIKDHAKKGGRPKGSKDKIPRALKDKVLTIAQQLEAEGKGLLDCARNDPPWFYQNFVKAMLPKEVDVKADIDGKLEISWQES
jgi:hypothetical protein